MDTKPFPIRVIYEMHSWPAILALGFALIMLSLSGFISLWNALDRIGDPYVVTNATIVDEKGNALPTPHYVKRGEDFIVQYQIDRRRLCRTDLVSFFKELPSDSIVNRSTAVGGTTGLGPQTTKNTIQVPATLKDGKCYQHLVQVINECTGNTIFNWPVPPVEVCVTE